jgi:hypothetical protein
MVVCCSHIKEVTQPSVSLLIPDEGCRRIEADTDTHTMFKCSQISRGL